jgi:anti-sigma factor RsiW
MADRPTGASDEALIAFVRGTLPEAEAEAIASEAGRSPELAAEIALARGIAAAVDAEAREPAPGALGWARLSRTLDAEPRPTARGRRPVWQLAASAAAAVLIWQVVAVPIISSRAGRDAGYAPVTEAPVGDFSVAVAFAPEAPEEAIRGLLREIDARVSDGPSAIGLWRLSFASGAARDAGLARLQAADIVESAQVQ